MGKYIYTLKIPCKRGISHAWFYGLYASTYTKYRKGFYSSCFRYIVSKNKSGNEDLN